MILAGLHSKTLWYFTTPQFPTGTKKKTNYPRIIGLSCFFRVKCCVKLVSNHFSRTWEALIFLSLFANVWHKSYDRRRSYPQRTMPLKIRIFTIITYVLSYHFCTVVSIFLCQNLCQIPKKETIFQVSCVKIYLTL